jgi:hypothetical protein
VQPLAPSSDALPVSPSLEDAYLYAVAGSQAAVRGQHAAAVEKVAGL